METYYCSVIYGYWQTHRDYISSQNFRVKDTQGNEEGTIQPQQSTGRPPGDLGNLQNTPDLVVCGCENVIFLRSGLALLSVLLCLHAFHYLPLSKKASGYHLRLSFRDLLHHADTAAWRPVVSAGCTSPLGIISLEYFSGSENVMKEFRCGLQILFEMLPGQDLTYQKSISKSH